MAATRLIPLHINKGKNIAQCLSDRTDYAENGDKTEEGKYVSSYGCDPKTVDEEFMLTKQKYLQSSGRDSERNVIAYQIRQSFKPGEITPKEANAIGYELARSFTKERHAFIVATHTDKAHIHNHIIFNSTSLDGQRKFRNFFMSSYAIRRISDRICLEHGLSIITPLPFAQRKKRTTYPQRESFRSSICREIDLLMKQHPENLQRLLELLQADGYDIRYGNNISVRGKNQKRYVRLSSLGSGYCQEDLKRILAGKTAGESETEFSYLINIEDKIRQGKGKGYVRWAKRFNLKQISQMMCFMKDNHIQGPEDLADRTKEAAEKFDELSAVLRKDENRLFEIALMKKQIINYARTKQVYADYRKAGYSKKFLEVHRDEILIHKAAKAFYEKMQGKKIPKVKDLNEEYGQILAEKRKVYGEYRQAKEKMKQYQIAQQIANEIMNEDEKRDRDKEQQEKNAADRKEL